MVWPFKKRKIIDLTDREARFVARQNLANQNTNTSEYKDLTSGDLNNTQTSSDSGSGFGDFFSAVSSSTSTSSASSTSRFDDPNLQIQGLKNQFEDIEYKMENLRKKIDDLLNRFEVVERRLHVGGY